MTKVMAQAPKTCDCCNGNLYAYPHFYDAAIPGRSWGWFCEKCFEMLGCSLGTGKGQKYDSETKVKVDG